MITDGSMKVILDIWKNLPKSEDPPGESPAFLSGTETPLSKTGQAVKRCLYGNFPARLAIFLNMADLQC